MAVTARAELPHRFRRAAVETAENQELYSDLVRECFKFPPTGKARDDDVDWVLYRLGYNSEFFQPCGRDGYTVTNALNDLDVIEAAVRVVRQRLQFTEMTYGDLLMYSPANKPKRIKDSVEVTAEKIIDVIDACVTDSKTKSLAVVDLKALPAPAEPLLPAKPEGTRIRARQKEKLVG